MTFSPSHIYYMITTECNQRCSKCSHWKNKDNSVRLDTDIIIKSIQQLTSTQEFCIVGGEPLLFKDEVLTIIAGVSSPAVRTTVITNGVGMTPDFLRSMSKYNVHIVVSIDTLDKEMWKYIRGCDSYDVVMNHLDHALSVFQPAKISIQSVLAKETEPFLSAVAKYARERNIYHSVQDYMTEGFNGSWTPVQSPLQKRDVSYDKCYAAGRNLSIMQNGDVYTCFQQSWIEGCPLPIGNLKTDSVLRMLNSEYTHHVMKKMKTCDLPCKVLKCNIKDSDEV